ncbi:hypothetical protein V1509DRAFT_635106 [Lipomyces kononenkoae]
MRCTGSRILTVLVIGLAVPQLASFWTPPGTPFPRTGFGATGSCPMMTPLLPSAPAAARSEDRGILPCSSALVVKCLVKQV